MKILLSVYGMFLGLFIIGYLYFVSKTNFEWTEYMYQDFFFMLSWLLIIIFSHKAIKYEDTNRGRVYVSLVYGILTWGIVSWMNYSLFNSYGIFLPIIAFIIGATVCYTINVKLFPAHVFLTLFCIVLVITFIETEGVFWFKFIYTFGAEGAREALSKVWFVLVVTYIIQMVFSKIRGEKKGFPFTIPRYGIVRKDGGTNYTTYNSQSKEEEKPKKTIMRTISGQSQMQSQPQQEVQTRSQKVRKHVEKNEDKQKEENVTTHKKIRRNVNMENFFEERNEPKLKKFLRDRINKE